MSAIATNRFTVGTTAGGYEVIDGDGRPVTQEYDSTFIASNVADELNAAARQGRSSLAKALGCLEYEV